MHEPIGWRREVNLVLQEYKKLICISCSLIGNLVIPVTGLLFIFHAYNSGNAVLQYNSSFLVAHRNDTQSSVQRYHYVSLSLQ